MVANLIKRSLNKIGYLTAGFTAVSLLVTAQTAVATGAPTLRNVQNLACVQQGQKLICDLNSSSNQAITHDQNGFESVNASDTQPFVGTTQPTHLVSTEQDKLISNILLGFLYFVLPVGFGLMLWLHDKNSGKRLNQLDQHIALLERIWHNHPLA